MKTILVITENPGFAEAVNLVLTPGRHRVIVQADVSPSDPIAQPDQLDAVIFDGDLTSVTPIRKIESLERLLVQCPFIVYADAKQWEWEEQAYIMGVMHILAKPVRTAILYPILEHLWAQRAPRRSPPLDSTLVRGRPEAVHSARPQETQNALGAMRNFSALLQHGLSMDSLIKEFLLLLRETVSVNRASVFLKPSPGTVSHLAGQREHQQLTPVCAIGIPTGLRQQVVLSLDSGVGGLLSRDGIILRRDSELVQSDEESRREFEILGAEVALPILDRETLMGVAFFDRHLTGSPLGKEELNLIFYMLEGLGMAIKNIWLHKEASNGRELLGEILGEMTSGCVVVGGDLTVLHMNSVARKFLGIPEASKQPVVFRDLPQNLGSKIYEVLKGAEQTNAFRYAPMAKDGRVYQVSVKPFSKGLAGAPKAALLLVEDCTESERLRHIEIETSNLRMIRTMAERLAHEIGNAIVPLSTHQQLFSNNYKDAEFRASLDVALHDGVKRIGRLGQQMLFLAQDRPRTSESISVSRLIEDAFREAQRNHGEQPVVLQYETGGKQLVLSGDKAGLKHALAEIMLNALQANPPSPKVRVETSEAADASGVHWLKILVQDSGSGFSAEATKKAPDAFFTTRNVGLGLGLTVSRKIIEMHQGRIDISKPDAGQAGLVTITLPLSVN